jgi:hypothetical protein
MVSETLTTIFLTSMLFKKYIGGHPKIKKKKENFLRFL